MSFFSDLFEGNFGNLGTDLTHAPSSLAKHPSEMWETAGGLAAAATGGLALGALGGGALGAGALGAAEGGAEFGGLLGAGDAVAAGTAGDLAAAEGFTAPAFGQAVGSAGGVLGENAATVPEMFANDFGAFGGAAPGSAGAGAAGEVAPIASGTVLDPTAMAAAPGGGSAEPGFFSGITDSLMHPTLKGVAQGAGVLAAGAGLGMNMMHGNTMDPNQQKLQDMAAQLGQQGQVLEHYLKTGKLPPALKAQLDQAKAAEKARVMSRFPAGSTPANSSAMAQELNNVDTNAVAAMAQVQIEMMNTGLKETGMSMQLYQILTTLDHQQNQDLMKSIMGFAAALSGGSAPRTV